TDSMPIRCRSACRPQKTGHRSPVPGIDPQERIMQLDHDNLRALAAVVREGSFERAAAALHVTPSAVSQRIKTLESRMGRLLVLRTIPVQPTDDGRILVRLAEQAALLEHE